MDEETGLYYYGTRYLDPKASIWISSDPALGEYMVRILRCVSFLFCIMIIVSCKKNYQDTSMNLSSDEFNIIWNNYLNYADNEYSSENNLIGYGYTEIHYYEYLCRQTLYNDKFFDKLSENEKMHYLYSLYSNIKNHYFYGKNTDSITEVFSEISIYPDIYSSKIEY